VRRRPLRTFKSGDPILAFLPLKSRTRHIPGVRIYILRERDIVMNQKNRVLQLIVIGSFISSLFVSPASANEITFDTSGIKVPAGITFNVDGVKSENGSTELLITIKSTLSPTSKVLAFKDFEISGISDEPNQRPQRIQYFDGESFNQQVTRNISDEDITNKKLNLIISGTGTLEDRSDIAYPNSYASVIAALDKMGLEATEGYNTWSSNDTYGYYVLAKLKSGVAPFQIKVKSTTLSSNGVVAETLKITNQPELMGFEPVEINLGYGFVDPSIKLTRVTLESVFAKYTPSTISSSFTFPAGLKYEKNDYERVYYDSTTKKSSINILVKNTTDRTISVNSSKLKIVDKSTSPARVVATIDSTYGLMSIQPSTGPDDYAYLNFSGDGDLTENLSLEVQGNLEPATPSKFNLSKVKIPTGFKMLPADFNNMNYDPKKAITVVSLIITKPGLSEDSPTLSFKNIKLTAGKSSTTYIYSRPYSDRDRTMQYYYHEVGSFKGDVRTGKMLTFSGNIEAVARTKYTNTASLDTNIKGLESNKVDPEFWKYNAKTKSTSITHYFDSSYGSNNESKVGTIYSCNLKILLNGKNFKAPTAGIKLDSGGDSIGAVVIATLPGDLRVKGGTVAVSGNYSLTPCK
jgi:hypothetical protein